MGREKKISVLTKSEFAINSLTKPTIRARFGKVDNGHTKQQLETYYTIAQYRATMYNTGIKRLGLEYSENNG